MRSQLAWCWVACGLLGCAGDRVIGRDCLDDDCRGGVALPAPGGCGAQYTLPPLSVEHGGPYDRCVLFTLRDLAPADESGRVYVIAAQAAMRPLDHHLDARLAPGLDDFDDGPVDCERLFARAVPWVPLMTAQGASNAVDFSAAPLVASRAHRLLINDRVYSLRGPAQDTKITLAVSCTTVQPMLVSQAFEFKDSEARDVLPGEHVVIRGSCVFDAAVQVTRLYRRTHLIDGFTVQSLSDPAVLWRSLGSEWTIDFDPPVHVAANDGFVWQCEYANATEHTFPIGGSSSDACSLFGLYRLPDGSPDPAPQHCQR